MKLKLSDWAAIAEVVSGVAVVVTLIFLIVGIRENTEVTRATAYDRNIDSLTQLRTEVVRDPELARIWQAFQDESRDALSEIDMVRLRLIVNNVFNIYEKSYFSYRYGLLGESEWSRFFNQICLQIQHARTFPGLMQSLHAVNTEEFMQYINDECRVAARDLP